MNDIAQPLRLLHLQVVNQTNHHFKYLAQLARFTVVTLKYGMRLFEMIFHQNISSSHAACLDCTFQYEKIRQQNQMHRRFYRGNIGRGALTHSLPIRM